MGGSTTSHILDRLRWQVSESAAGDPQDRPTMGRVFIYLFGLGGTLAMLTLALPAASDRSEPGIVVAALGAYAVAATVLFVFDRLPLAFFYALPPMGTLLASLVVFSGGPGPVAAYAGFYFWVVLSAFSFFGLRAAVLNLALVAAVFAAVLREKSGVMQAEVQWAMVLGTLTVVGLVIAALRHRLEVVVKQLRRRVSQQGYLVELNKLALADDDLSGLMRSAAARVAQGLGVEHTAIFELTADQAHLYLRASSGWDLTTGTDSAPFSDPLIGCAFTEDRAVVIDDILVSPVPQSSGPGKDAGLESAIAAPISGPKGPVGVLAAWSDAPNSFGRADLTFLQAAANVLADARHRLETETQIRRQALYDPLTGRPNRAHFIERVRDALHRRQAGAGELALYVLDVDDFKLLNDSAGQSAGDEVLRAIPARLRKSLRLTDTVARLGGDEFAVLCEGIAGDDAMETAERMLDSLNGPFKVDERSLRVSASLGVSLSSLEEIDAEAMVARAEAAMFRAKEERRGGFEVFDDHLQERMRTRLRFEGELLAAAEGEGLALVFQPIVSLENGSLRGCEALLRWTHPAYGAVPPDEFIPVAEKTGAIVPIGDWVIRTALEQVERWRRECPQALPVHINISPRQITEGQAAERIQGAVEEFGLGRGELAFEVTEHSLMYETDSFELLSRLRDLGAHVVLDDFGTGYSSLSHMKRFPLDAVKIDRGFVSADDGSRRDEAIVKAVVGMARAFELDVVAEGIETPEQASLMRWLGCGLGQGYLFGRPVAAAEFSVPAEFRT